MLNVIFMNKTKILCVQLNCLVKLADVSTRLDALVILRVKVKQGAKRWCSYRRGYCTRTPMRLGAEAEGCDDLYHIGTFHVIFNL